MPPRKDWCDKSLCLFFHPYFTYTLYIDAKVAKNLHTAVRRDVNLTYILHQQPFEGLDVDGSAAQRQQTLVLQGVEGLRYIQPLGA